MFESSVNFTKCLLFHTTVHASTKLEHSCVYPSFNLVFHFCVNILSFFVENRNINIRDELRNFSQQPNFKKPVEQDRLIRGLVRNKYPNRSCGAMCVQARGNFFRGGVNNLFWGAERSAKIVGG